MTTLDLPTATRPSRPHSVAAYILCGVLLLLAVLLFYGQTLGRGPGRLFDFNIAYCASSAWWHGANPYDQGAVVGHWEAIGGAKDLGNIAYLWVVHAPATFAVTLPFALLPPLSANTAWLAFSLLSLAVLLACACKAAGVKLGSPASLGVVACALLCTPIQLAVYHGQPALPSIACCMAAYVAAVAGRQRTAAVLLALALCIKPHIALPCLLFLAMRRQWATLLYTVVLFGAVSLFAVIWMGAHGHTSWLADWRANLYAATHHGDTNDYTFGNGLRFDLVQLHIPWFGILGSRAMTEVAVMLTTLVLAASYLWLRRRREQRDDLLDFSILSLLCLLPFYHRWPDVAVIVPVIAWTISNAAQARLSRAPGLALLTFVLPITVFANAAIPFALALPTSLMAERAYRILIEPFQTWCVVALLFSLLSAMRATPHRDEQSNELPRPLDTSFPRSWALWLCCGLLPIAILIAVCPQDASWIADEPGLIGMALQHNAQGTIATHGLKGTQGAIYGPLAAWLYQGYLHLSSNLVALVVLRSGLMVLLTGTSLLLTSRLCRMPAWGLLLALLSPFFWLYSRQIWDNSFCIPLAGWAFAGYALFLAGRRWGISIFTLCAGLLVLTHLMSIPLLAAIVLHALVTQHRQLRRAAWHILIPLALIILAGAGYWPVLLRGLRSGQSLVVPSQSALLFTLGGGNWFGGTAFIPIVGQEWFTQAPAILRVLLLVMSVMVLLVPAGILLAITRLVRAARAAAPWSLADQLCAVALLTLVLQFLYYGVRNAIGHVHYYNASWIAYAFLIGLCCHWLSQWHPGRAAVAGVVACAACALLALILQLHRTEGTRSLSYGPTLANQTQVARTLTQLPPGSKLFPLVPDIASIPTRIQVLMALQSPDARPEDTSPQAAYIVYASDRAADGRICVQLEPLPSSAPAPATAPHQSAPITR